MKPSVIAACGLAALATATAAPAHRLDEYLQASTIALERSRIRLDVRLVPGAMVWPQIRQQIDANADGELSRRELAAYAQRLEKDLSLVLDGKRLRLRLLRSAGSTRRDFEEGLGAIELQFSAHVPGSGNARSLSFENRHQAPIASYLVNCLVPTDPGIRIVLQDRNVSQSWYRLDYTQSGALKVSGPR